MGHGLFGKFTLLILAIWPVALFAPPFCDVYYPMLAARKQAFEKEGGSTKEVQSSLAEAVMDAVAAHGKKLAAEQPDTMAALPLESEPNPYHKLIDPHGGTGGANGPRLYDYRKAEEADRVGNTDARFVARLPEAGTPTVWALLSPSTRLEVARRIQAFLRIGKYDREMVLQPDNPQMRAALDDFMDAALLAGNTDAQPGINPWLVMHAAKNGETVGVCRHGNCSLVGILGELGIAPKNIRMVVGQATKDSRHIWVEIRTSDDGPWVELDATARDMDKKTAILHSLANTGDVGSNRTRYPNGLRVIPHVLEPMQLHAVKLQEIREQLQSSKARTFQNLFGPSAP